jgi:hypothetical protein
MMRFGKTVFLLAAILGVSPVFAADMPADNMQILREKVQADRKLVIAANMDLTESEAKEFWPVYNEYVNDLADINRRTLALIGNYAADYRADSLTDQKAKNLTEEALGIEEAELKLKRSYVEKLGKILPEKKVARAMQIENKIRAMTKFDLSDQIPLVK